MTLKIILPGQAPSFLTRALDLTPHAAEAVASTSVVVADRTVVRPPGGSQAAMAQLLSDTLLRILILDSLGGRVDTSLPSW